MDIERAVLGERRDGVTGDTTVDHHAELGPERPDERKALIAVGNVMDGNACSTAHVAVAGVRPRPWVHGVKHQQNGFSQPGGHGRDDLECGPAPGGRRTTPRQIHGDGPTQTLRVDDNAPDVEKRVRGESSKEHTVDREQRPSRKHHESKSVRRRTDQGRLPSSTWARSHSFWSHSSVRNALTTTDGVSRGIPHRVSPARNPKPQLR